MAVIYTKRMNRYLQEHSQPYDPAVFFCVIRKAAVYSSSDAAWLLLVKE